MSSEVLVDTVTEVLHALQTDQNLESVSIKETKATSLLDVDVQQKGMVSPTMVISEIVNFKTENVDQCNNINKLILNSKWITQRLAHFILICFISFLVFTISCVSEKKFPCRVF